MALRGFTAIGASAAALAGMWPRRRLIGCWAITAVMSRRPLIGPVRLPDGVRWWDDWFTVEQLDARTWAIGEPRYYQLNHSYLLTGSERALLFDSGPGLRPIGAVVRELTNLPVTATASHLHFDHTGGHVDFADVALVHTDDGPPPATPGWFEPTRRQHLGMLEAAVPARGFHATELWRPGDLIDLGERELELIHTPGHSAESVSLLDRESNLCFVGDLIHDGDVLAALPGADLAQYRRSAELLAELVDDDTLLMGGHTTHERPRAPRLERFDLLDLADVIERLPADPTGPLGFPRRHHVNDRMELFVA